MKKFLAILLIAIVACSTASVIEEKEIDLEKLPAWIKKGWSKVLDSFKKVFQLLKQSGIWDRILSILKSAGRSAAQSLCLKLFDLELCDELINGVFIKIVKGTFSSRTNYYDLIRSIQSK